MKENIINIMILGEDNEFVVFKREEFNKLLQAGIEAGMKFNRVTNYKEDNK